jgi:hypothetical protein
MVNTNPGAGLTKAQRLAFLEAENQELRAELEGYQREKRPKRDPTARQEIGPDMIRELYLWSEQGQFLEEILAAWGWTVEEWTEACGNDVQLGQHAARARARARGAILRMIREGLLRSSFPTALADRLLLALERESLTASADELIRVYVPADSASVGGWGQAIELMGDNDEASAHDASEGADAAPHEPTPEPTAPTPAG